MKIDECYFNKKNKLKKRHKNENKCYFNEEKIQENILYQFSIAKTLWPQCGV